MEFDYKSRLAKLRARITRRRLDGFLVVNRNNIYYLSGFSGEDSWLLITLDRAFLVTDFRFREQARAETSTEYEIRERGVVSLIEVVASICREFSLKKIGFEESHLSYAGFSRFKKVLRKADLKTAGRLVEDLRMIKDLNEIKIIRRSAQVTTRVLKKIVNGFKPPATELKLARRITTEFLKTGVEPAFPPIAALGAHTSQPHAVASDRIPKYGDILLIDLGAKMEAYNSDMTRTFVLGEFPRGFKSIYRSVLISQRKAIQAIRPGIRACEIDKIARGYLEKKGYGSYFGHSLGHGVGLDVHEGPVIGSHSGDVLKEGMVLTIEPGVYIPGWGGIRIEDTILVTGEGCDILTEYPKDYQLLSRRSYHGKKNYSWRVRRSDTGH